MNLTDASKETYGAQSSGATHQDIQTGAIQRIATACELMANNYQKLIDDRDMYKRWYEERVKEVEGLSRTNSALRGVITKLKKEPK